MANQHIGNLVTGRRNDEQEDSEEGEVEDNTYETMRKTTRKMMAESM